MAQTKNILDTRYFLYFVTVLLHRQYLQGCYWYVVESYFFVHLYLLEMIIFLYLFIGK